MSTGQSVLPAATVPGAVHLTVADLDGAHGFYERTLGLEPLERADGLARLGAGGTAMVELAHRPAAPARPPGTTGLFHLAILVPDRAALASAMRRVTGSGWRLTGASDHLVSEALYLHDPEGNGIEIYRDRPREEWPRANGEVRMDTLPLDLDDLLEEADTGDPRRMPAATRIGHVHLNVSDLAAGEDFYGRLLGLDVTVRSYPGALFLSAGGYHHHVALNTWAGEGAPAPPEGSRGLAHFELVVPEPADVEASAERLGAAGVEVKPEGAAIALRDPAGNGLALHPGGSTLRE